MLDDSRQADVHQFHQAYGDRGVYVPDGMSALEIMEGAAALEREYEVAPYTARSMVRSVLRAIKAAKSGGERPAP